MNKSLKRLDMARDS